MLNFLLLFNLNFDFILLVFFFISVLRKQKLSKFNDLNCKPRASSTSHFSHVALIESSSVAPEFIEKSLRKLIFNN